MSSRPFLFVQSTSEVGGAETVLCNALAASDALRRRSAVALLQFGQGDLAERLRKMDVPVVPLPRGRLRDPRWLLASVWRLRRISREMGVRCLVANGAHPQVVAGPAARLAGRRSVFLVNLIHDVPLRRNPIIDQAAFTVPCDLALANSKACLATLSVLKPRTKLGLLYPGTASEPVAQGEARRAREELGVGERDVLFGVFGRLQRWKGQDVFVEAAARLPSPARFVVIGGSTFGLEREFHERLVQRVGQLGLADRFVFTGFRDDVPRLMAACDVVCHTTRKPEPFGMVVVEAMAQGRPVIATRGGGPSEIVGDGREVGLLVPPDDPEQLADAMRSLMADASQRARLGQAAIQRVRAAFSRERMADELLEFLETV